MSDWLHRIWRWAIEWKFFGGFLVCTILVPCFAMLLALLATPERGKAEFCIRTAGLFYQSMGILTVAWDVHETRSLFGHPTFLAQARSILRRFPKLRRPSYVGVAACDVTAITCDARARVRDAAGPNPTIETRIEALEKNLSRVADELDQTRQQIEADLRKTNSELSSESRAREDADMHVRRLLERTATGGLHVSSVGVFWLFLGVVLGTWSHEIAGLWK